MIVGKRSEMFVETVANRINHWGGRTLSLLLQMIRVSTTWHAAQTTYYGHEVSLADEPGPLQGAECAWLWASRACRYMVSLNQMFYIENNIT